MYSKQAVAATLDHAVLSPNATYQDIVNGAELCIKYKVASFCVRPVNVSLAVFQCDDKIPISAVIGFPHGSNLTDIKLIETQLAVEDGAKELDMVMNIDTFLSGDYNYVEREIVAIVTEANVLIKVILETCYLNNKQIELACKICEAAGADYVKTSTGFGPGGATPEAVDIMLNSTSLSVKASGGIHSWKEAIAFLDQGCKRLGVSSTEDILC